MRNAFVISTTLHAGLIAAVWVGLPSTQPDLLASEEPVFIEIVDVAEMRNAPPPQAEVEAEPAPVPEAEPEPEPNVVEAAPAPPPPTPTPAPEPAPLPEPEPVAEAPPAPEPEPVPEPVPAQPEPEIAALPPEPEPLPEPEPAPELEPEPVAEPEPEPAPAPKPEPKQAALPPEQPQKFASTKVPKKPERKKFELSSVLKTLEEVKQKQPPQQAEEPENKPEPKDDLMASIKNVLSQSSEPFDPDKKVSQLEIDQWRIRVREQVQPCWSPPVGAPGAETLAPELRLRLRSDGTVQSVEVLDPARAFTDRYYKAAIESARRAVLNPRCQPFDLPAEKYTHWKTLKFRFDPSGML